MKISETPSFAWNHVAVCNTLHTQSGTNRLMNGHFRNGDSITISPEQNNMSNWSYISGVWCDVTKKRSETNRCIGALAIAPTRRSRWRESMKHSQLIYYSVFSFRQFFFFSGIDFRETKKCRVENQKSVFCRRLNSARGTMSRENARLNDVLCQPKITSHASVLKFNEFRRRQQRNQVFADWNKQHGMGSRNDLI